VSRGGFSRVVDHGGLPRGLNKETLYDATRIKLAQIVFVPSPVIIDLKVPE